MPLGDPTAPIPEKDMRILRPIGLAIAALFIGANGALILVMLVEGEGILTPTDGGAFAGREWSRECARPGDLDRCQLPSWLCGTPSRRGLAL